MAAATGPYRLYGRVIRSPWLLDAPLAAAGERVDVDIMRAGASAFREARSLAGLARDPEDWFSFRRLPDGWEYIRWKGLFEFLVAPGGRRILALPTRRASSESFRTYLLGQVLSFALLEMGVEPLHGTASVVDGRALGFLGPPGSGKSTLAAAFLQEGWPLLTDDLLVVQMNDGRPLAEPGYPRIKLFPEIAKRLLPGIRPRGRMNPETPKLVHLLEGRQIWPSRAPLERMYVLRPGRASGARITVRTLTPRRAFTDLTRNTFNPVVADPGRLEQHMDTVAAIVEVVAVKSLSFGRDLDVLSSVREAILRDLRR